MKDRFTLAGMKAEVASVEERITRNLDGRGLIAREMTDEALRSVMLHAGMTEKAWADYMFDKKRIAELERTVELRTTAPKVEPRRSDGMSEDMAALIARQQAEQAAREASPGRYDGVPLKDLAHRMEVEQMGIAAWRTGNDVETPPEFDARLRAVAAYSPPAAAAFGLLNQGVPVIVPIDDRGSLMADPTRDVDVIAAWFEPDGPYSTCWPAIPCGPQGGVFGLLTYPGEGWDWFKKVATVHQPSRVERLMAAVGDRVDALGIPGISDSWDDEVQPKPDERRATMAATLWLCEDLAAHRPVVRAWTGGLRGPAGQAAMAAGRPPQARQLTAHVWSWPSGHTLPVGRELRNGVESLAAIPAFGAVLNLGGARLVVRQTPALMSPPPDWLIAAVQELA